MTAPARPVEPAASEPASPPDVVERRSVNPASHERLGSRTALLSPLVAICGLCGGAGASTLSYLLARHAVAHGPGNVLVCDTGGATGGLAAYAGVQSARSLPEVAARVAAGLPVHGGAFATDPTTGPGEWQLRVIATAPQPGAAESAAGVEELLTMARSDSVHALTVIDCGVPAGDLESAVLGSASHIAWVIPATTSALARATLVLNAICPHSTRPELVVARRDPHEPSLSLKPFKRLAEARHAPLVLMPQVPTDPRGQPVRALRAAQVSLQAIHGALGR